MASTIFRRRKGLGVVTIRDFASPTSTSDNHINGHGDLAVVTPNRSGSNRQCRPGYDEHKCRNVLVRYCAHVPRNYQYRDGIPQIFLILREHLGDENLDLAGGVLYELIEIDCQHTDDPGAAFQRWRHDHMCRYADFELPHVPHMTTITQSIVPTETLARWRSGHAERYPFVLSDSSPSPDRSSFDPSCIRSRKSWLIDHTVYVSSRAQGTLPLQSPTPKEFHEMQWSAEYGHKGRLVEEREISISPPRTADTTSTSAWSSKHCPSTSEDTPLVKLLRKFRKESTGLDQRPRSWLRDAGRLLADRRPDAEPIPVPLPDGCEVPNAIFARKHGLIDDNVPLGMWTGQMPTAESKAMNTIVEAARTGLLASSCGWHFRGPFTPQLGFDGGLDYQWSHEPTITVRRFDVPSDRGIGGHPLLQKTRHPRTMIIQRDSPKRQGIVFEIDDLAPW